ncbi:MAG: TetR/AcrR family transcriptional regulator [Chloroflexi bacterium]|nr:TetR/AcrR family transcriptional regulator [Chloroflexota bacterium]
MADKNTTTRNRKFAIPKITSDDLDSIVNNGTVNAKLLQIVQTAAELFHQKGYASTTTRDIANACNISPGHLYYYIKSKDDFVEIFMKIQESDLEKWEKVVRRLIKRLPPDELIVEIVREFIYYIHMRRNLVIFWYQAIAQINNGQRTGIMQIEIRTIDLFKEIIELGCKTGQFHIDDPFVVACNIHAMCITWALKRYLLKRKCTIEQYTDVCIKLVAAMLRGTYDS